MRGEAMAKFSGLSISRPSHSGSSMAAVSAALISSTASISTTSVCSFLLPNATRKLTSMCVEAPDPRTRDVDTSVTWKFPEPPAVSLAVQRVDLYWCPTAFRNTRRSSFDLLLISPHAAVIKASEISCGGCLAVDEDRAADLDLRNGLLLDVIVVLAIVDTHLAPMLPSALIKTPEVEIRDVVGLAFFWHFLATALEEVGLVTLNSCCVLNIMVRTVLFVNESSNLHFRSQSQGAVGNP